MLPLNHILIKYRGNKFGKFLKISNQMYMDYIKPLAKYEKELETLSQTIRIYSHYLGVKFVVEKKVTCI